MKDLANSNCSKCKEFFEEECIENDGPCMCKDCPRNLGKCVVTKWCSETESALEY